MGLTRVLEERGILKSWGLKLRLWELVLRALSSLQGLKIYIGLTQGLAFCCCWVSQGKTLQGTKKSRFSGVCLARRMCFCRVWGS